MHPPSYIVDHRAEPDPPLLGRSGPACGAVGPDGSI